MDFDGELMKLIRSNSRFRSAVSDLLYDVFDTLDDGNFSKDAFLQKFAKRERGSQKSSIDTIRRIMKTKIQQLLKVDESIVVDEPVKAADMEFPLRTLDDMEAGGYKEHYKVNTVVDPDQSNHVDKLFPTRAPQGTNDKVKKPEDHVGFEHFQPLHHCPKCKGTNLFNSLHEKYVECEDCDSLVLRENLEVKLSEINTQQPESGGDESEYMEKVKTELKKRIDRLKQMQQSIQKANPLHSLPQTKAHLKVIDLRGRRLELMHFYEWVSGEHLPYEGHDPSF